MMQYLGYLRGRRERIDIYGQSKKDQWKRYKETNKYTSYKSNYHPKWTIIIQNNKNIIKINQNESKKGKGL